MVDEFEFWIHGVNTQYSEYDLEELRKQGVYFEIRRNEKGFIIKRTISEEKLRDNLYEADLWFNLAIPTGRILDDDWVKFDFAKLRVSANQAAEVVQVLIWFGGYNANLHVDVNPHLTNTYDELMYDIKDEYLNDAIVIRVLVRFRENGEFILHSAGAQQEEQ